MKALLITLPLLPLLGQPFDRAKLVDLTYTFDEKTIYWPTAKPFQWNRDAWGKSEGGYWYASGTFTTSEHGGTHLDSPVHFGFEKMAVDQIPLSQLVGPARVIDITQACAKDRNYRMTPADIEAYERRHGRIQTSDIVIVRTGWGRHWPDRKAYLGDDTPGDASKLSFPGISKEAAEILVARKIGGVGIDTASLDYGASRDFIAHQILNGANIYGLENVANLDRLPATGATLIALPIKTRGGTGGPVRVIAILP